MQFHVLLDIESTKKTYLHNQFLKKDIKPDTLADTQTYIRTWQLYDQPGPEGRIGENTLGLLVSEI